MLIISRALRNSGVVDQISRSVMPFTKNQIPHILSLSLVVMVLSAFMNNVGALALMLPVAMKTAIDRQRSPTILLLPMAFASILGGMMTMIGTPPNIIIANLRAELTDEPAFGLFAFSPVGGLVAIAGLLFIVLVGWRLIPGKSHKKPGMESLFQIDDYITEISTPDGVVHAAVDGGFISVADDRVSILTEHALLAEEIHIDEAKAELEAAETLPTGDERELRIRRASARIRAAEKAS
mgnify:CR=1 FL=1